MLHLARGGPDDCNAVRDLATDKIADVTAKIQRLEAIRDALTNLVDTCRRPRQDRECPLLAAELPVDAQDDVRTYPRAGSRPTLDGMGRTLLARLHNPRNHVCACLPSCWCQRTKIGYAVR